MSNLFFGDPHVISNISENGWLDEVASIAVSLATGQQFGSLLLARFDQSENLLKLVFVDLENNLNKNHALEVTSETRT